MRNVLKTTLSVFLLLTLFMGVVDSCFDVFFEMDPIEWSDESDNNDEEEDVMKEVLKKRMVYHEVHHQACFLIVHCIVRFSIPPSCLLEGHTGQVTPPPWS